MFSTDGMWWGPPSAASVGLASAGLTLLLLGFGLWQKGVEKPYTDQVGARTQDDGPVHTTPTTADGVCTGYCHRTDNVFVARS